MIGAELAQVRRLLPASVQEVFKWWTDPALLERWMSPTGSVEAEVDLRVGGALRIVMTDGPMRIEHHGEYVEIDPPRLLVFTWESRYTSGRSIVSVTLEPADHDCTRLVIVHRQLPAGAARSHAQGWAAIAERLERELARDSNSGGGNGRD